MYDFMDRPVTMLDRDGRFLLRSMRSWEQSAKRRVCPIRTLGGPFAAVFGRAHAAMILPDFHKAMAFLYLRPAPPLALSAIGSRTIAEDEGLLLALWRDVAIGRRDNASATLAHVVPSDTVAAIVQAMSRASAALTIAGFGMALIDPLSIEDRS